MSPTPTERQLRSELASLDPPTESATAPDVAIEWGEPAPTDRPDGMAWAVASEPAADAPATLTYDLWSAQQDCLAALDAGDADIVAFLAGYGSGKTVFGARWLLAQALAHPGSRFLAVGVDFQKARDTTYPKLFAALPGERTTLVTTGFNGPENSPLVADYNRQQHRLTLVNDSVITLGSADKYSRYAGAEFGAVWMDEPSHYGDELHDLVGMITTRLRGVAGPKVQLWTLTGEGYNAAWEILEQRQDADGEPIGLDIKVVRASVLDNPYLTDGEKARFKRKYAGTGKEQQALHGGFAAATGLVYSSFSRETNVLSHAEALDRLNDTDEWRIYGYDAGWNDPRVLLEAGQTPYGQIVVLDEFYRSETHVEDVIGWLRRHDKPQGFIVCEHEPADITKFRQAGYRAERANKSLDAGIAEVRWRFESDGEGRPGLLISDRCQHLIRELLSYKETHVRTATAEDHAADALRYLIMGEEAVERERERRESLPGPESRRRSGVTTF
ncbi:terminase large subunit domain-containing protein [Halomarina pelagica]|uniref:terminase large subunit domain-containing protein n=1 Tax=Halomarina pelagica TaxID=2961599 RepID=UPI0020C284A4|nr:terminase family protein [Halomarina sp. BND7]